jgi:hypothetical protein
MEAIRGGANATISLAGVGVVRIAIQQTVGRIPLKKSNATAMDVLLRTEPYGRTCQIMISAYDFHGTTTPGESPITQPRNFKTHPNMKTDSSNFA